MEETHRRRNTDADQREPPEIERAECRKEVPTTPAEQWRHTIETPMSPSISRTDSGSEGRATGQRGDGKQRASRRARQINDEHILELDYTSRFVRVIHIVWTRELKVSRDGGKQ